MKKVLTLLLVAVMLVTCMAVTAFAAEAGDTIEIAFTASNPGAAVFGAQINYDSTALELVSISAGDLTSNGMFSGTASTGKVAYLGMSNITGSGSVFVAQFKVLDAAEAGKTYQITATVDTTTTADANGDLVSFSITGGSITIDKLVCEHVWDEGKVTKDATCIEDGVKTYTCTVAGCGETKTEAIPAIGHSFGEWKQTKAATCTEKGEETRECACGEKETREVAATGHKFGEWKVTKAATCTEKGEETRECACGEKETREIAATGHKFGEWKVTKAATCTEKGEETRECACGEKETREIAATGHKFGEWKVTKAATCTEKGEETRECACGEKETREIATTGHKFGEWKVTKAATCTEKGEETRECACGEKEIREIPVVEHALNTYGKDSTHHWTLCDNCDYVGEKEDHDYDYNGVCVCGATKPVVDDPNLDDVPQTGDITPYIAMTSVAFLIAVAAAAAFVLKRKAVK